MQNWISRHVPSLWSHCWYFMEILATSTHSQHLCLFQVCVRLLLICSPNIPYKRRTHFRCFHCAVSHLIEIINPFNPPKWSKSWVIIISTAVECSFTECANSERIHCLSAGHLDCINSRSPIRRQQSLENNIGINCGSRLFCCSSFGRSVPWVIYRVSQALSIARRSYFAPLTRSMLFRCNSRSLLCSRCWPVSTPSQRPSSSHHLARM